MYYVCMMMTYYTGASSALVFVFVFDFVEFCVGQSAESSCQFRGAGLINDHF